MKAKIIQQGAMLRNYEQ